MQNPSFFSLDFVWKNTVILRKLGFWSHVFSLLLLIKNELMSSYLFKFRISGSDQINHILGGLITFGGCGGILSQKVRPAALGREDFLDSGTSCQHGPQCGLFLTSHKVPPLNLQSVSRRPNSRDSSDQSTLWPQGKYEKKSGLLPGLCLNPQEVWKISNWEGWGRASCGQGHPVIPDPGGAVLVPTLMNPGGRKEWTVGRGAGLNPEFLY